MFSIILKSDGTTQNYLYLHRDYLGSIVAITNQEGNVVEKRLFDAWGNITQVQDGAGVDLNVLTILDRGYTGHEHLQGVHLIHMNGRLYDPVIHRFLQPDNFVQDPFYTQNYNRYGYCWNNPLKFTDPSGEIIPLIVGGIILVSAAINVYSNWDDITGGTGKFSDIKWGKFFGYTTSGAISGALTVYGGPYGVIWAGGVQSILNSSIKGDDFATTVKSASLGVMTAAFSMGVGDGLSLMFPKGFFNIQNPILNDALNGLFSGTISGFITDYWAYGSFKKSFKNNFNLFNVVQHSVTSALQGSLNRAQTGAKSKQNRPIIESLQLNSIPSFNYFNTPLIIPNVNIILPTRTVIPPNNYINLPKHPPRL